MGTIHNKAKIGEIAKRVLMPGDPLRAKQIAEKYLENVRLVNDVRNVFAYTGEYKGNRITVMASGMGIPSMGIYSYELFTYYDVEVILRIGSCGVYDNSLELNDIVLVNSTYSESNFAKHFRGIEKHISYPSKDVNEKVMLAAENLRVNVKVENMACTECFEGYTKDIFSLYNRFPKELDIKGSEMEAFALFETAEELGKKAGCILTVADRIGSKSEVLSAVDREKSLNTMNKLGLETLIMM